MIKSGSIHGNKDCLQHLQATCPHCHVLACIALMSNTRLMQPLLLPEMAGSIPAAVTAAAWACLWTQTKHCYALSLT